MNFAFFPQKLQERAMHKKLNFKTTKDLCVKTNRDLKLSHPLTKRENKNNKSSVSILYRNFEQINNPEGLTERIKKITINREILMNIKDLFSSTHISPNQLKQANLKTCNNQVTTHFRNTLSRLTPQISLNTLSKNSFRIKAKQRFESKNTSTSNKQSYFSIKSIINNKTLSPKKKENDLEIFGYDDKSVEKKIQNPKTSHNKNAVNLKSKLGLKKNLHTPKKEKSKFISSQSIQANIANQISGLNDKQLMKNKLCKKNINSKGTIMRSVLCDTSALNSQEFSLDSSVSQKRNYSQFFKTIKRKEEKKWGGFMMSQHFLGQIDDEHFGMNTFRLNPLRKGINAPNLKYSNSLLFIKRKNKSDCVYKETENEDVNYGKFKTIEIPDIKNSNIAGIVSNNNNYAFVYRNANKMLSDIFSEKINEYSQIKEKQKFQNYNNYIQHGKKNYMNSNMNTLKYRLERDNIIKETATEISTEGLNSMTGTSHINYFRSKNNNDVIYKESSMTDANDYNISSKEVINPEKKVIKFDKKFKSNTPKKNKATDTFELNASNYSYKIMQRRFQNSNEKKKCL